MFSVVTVYDTILPGVSMTAYGELAWDFFFHGVKYGRSMVCSYYNTDTGARHLVEYDAKKKEFIHR